jgi:hypothetical protein
MEKWFATFGKKGLQKTSKVKNVSRMKEIINSFSTLFLSIHVVNSCWLYKQF